MGRIHVGVLGPVTVQRDGEDVRLSPASVRVLLRLVAAEGRPVPAGELWGGTGEFGRIERSELQKRVAELRRALGTGVVVTVPGAGYRLVLGRDQLDAYQYEDLVGRAADAEPSAAEESLAQALALWRGSPLPEVADAGFAQPLIRRLNARHTTARGELARNPYKVWRRRCEDLAAMGESVSGVLAEAFLRSLAGQAGHTAERLRSERLRVVFVGGFKSGKSSLINALLGTKVLTTAASPTTAAFTVIRWSPQPFAEVSDLDGEAARKIPLDALDHHLRSGDHSRGVMTVLLGVDSELCRYGLEIVDTPGPSEDVRLQEVLLQSFASADAVVYVTNALFPLGGEELALAERAQLLAGEQSLFVLNKIDTLTPDERGEVVTRFRERIAEHLPGESPRVFPLSARTALAGLAAGDAAMSADSGLPEFEEALGALLTGRVARPRLLRFAGELAGQIELGRRLLGEQSREAGKLLAQRERVLSVTLDVERIVEADRAATSRDVAVFSRSFFIGLAGRIDGWAEGAGVQPMARINPMRTRQHTESAVREMTARLSENLEREVSHWARYTLPEFLLPRVERTVAAVRARTAEVAPPVGDLVFEPPLALFDVRLPSGHSTGAVLSQGLTVATLIAAIGGTSPLGLLAGVVAGGVLNQLWSKSAMGELRRKVVEEAKLSIERNAEEFADAVAETVNAHYRTILQSVRESFDEHDRLLREAVEQAGRPDGHTAATAELEAADVRLAAFTREIAGSVPLGEHA
ncbi:dynamin family protein [Sphaerisporangium sp. B11E5]|uniref:dynamin family protein n=1 Tax=Sphaerisporangium sp. B11E5 TaxID=3153563 RepID=UPI00325EDF33